MARVYPGEVMGLKQLCEHLGSDYSVNVNTKTKKLNVSLYTNNQKIWSTIKSTTFDGLFKEHYYDIIKDLIPNSPFFVDKDKKK